MKTYLLLKINELLIDGFITEIEAGTLRDMINSL